MEEGIDYAWGRPDPAKIVAAGKSFVARYVSHDTTGKNLTRAEAERLSAAGLSLVIVFESTANRMLGGAKAGIADAEFAAAEAIKLGMPAGRPIYFACDFDARAAQQGAIDGYLRGAASVIGLARTGMYGGYWPIKRSFDAKTITWGWQTYAWSGGAWDARAQLRQYKNELIFDGVSIDLDRSTVEDFGQWKIGATMAISKPDLDAIAVAVLNKDGVIPSLDPADPNKYRALRTHIHELGLNVVAIRAILGEMNSPNPADTTEIIAGVLKGLDGGTGKGMINQIIDGVVAGVLSGPQPAPVIDTDAIADKIVGKLARRMES